MSVPLGPLRHIEGLLIAQHVQLECTTQSMAHRHAYHVHQDNLLVTVEVRVAHLLMPDVTPICKDLQLLVQKVVQSVIIRQILDQRRVYNVQMAFLLQLDLQPV